MMTDQRKRTMVRAACVLAVFLVAAAAALLFVLRDRTPDPPDITTISLREAMRFEASDAYNELSESKRRAFSEAVVARLQALPFEDLLRLALDPARMEERRKRLANLRELPNYDELHSELAADFLEKFYGLPAFKRKVYLTAFALYQETESRLDPGRYEVPKPGEFHADAVKLFSKQSPAMKAYAMQFLIDLRQQRQKLGLRDLPIPMN